MRNMNRVLLSALAMLCLTGGGNVWAKDKGVSATALSSTLVPAVANPRRIAGGPDGQILVTDRRYGAVIAVDKQSLQPVWSATLPDGGPFGIAFTRKGIFVGNTATKNVEVYSLNGSGGPDTLLEFDRNLGDVPAGTIGTIENAIAVAADDKAKQIFVLDGAAKRISVFDRKGSLLRSFEPRGSDNLLLSPVSLAIDELRREILVADYGDPSAWLSNCSFCSANEPARIMIFSYEGDFLYEIRGDGTTHWLTSFARLQGLAASGDGRIFAADPLGARILVFDRFTGAILDELGVKGTNPGQLMAPSDLWLDIETGDLFISNNLGARRVEVLRGVGGQP
ncbi:MAG: NHL repeat-containing protein [Alphaproteobacteria bacterium]|nr:NHL repeat-containing protein [Alphaproteobacteria bacterium]